MVTTAQCTFEPLPVDQVELDRTNPRIAKWLEMYGDEITPEQMSLALGAAGGDVADSGTTFTSLRESIKTHQGVIHPIIVSKERSGRIVVIEGNTRVLIYREFLGQGVDGDWTTIPAMVYQELSPADIDAIRLQAHLVGPRAWDPYSKAKYLHHLRNQEHLPLEQIVDYCGGQKREVLDYIDAFVDMESTYRDLLDSDADFDPTRFSAFVELQRPRVQQALLDTGFGKEDFARWVKDQLLSPLNMVRRLPGILRNEKSKEVFLTDGAAEAVKVLDLPSAESVLLESTLEQLAREIYRKIRQMEYSELQRLRSTVNAEENEILCDARDELIRLCEDIASDN